jgi:hypothetical protein
MEMTLEKTGKIHMDDFDSEVRIRDSCRFFTPIFPQFSRVGCLRIAAQILK